MAKDVYDFFSESKAVSLIIAVNVYFFFLFHFSSHITLDVLKSLILSPETLRKGHYFSVISSGFIHYDFMHLFLNMLGVMAFGRIVERYFGFFKTIYIYLGALIIAMLFATLVNGWVIGRELSIIGASGAVMGLLATAMLLDPYAITYEMILPVPVMFKGWLYLYADLIGLLSKKPDGISHLSHMFGFLSIFILVYVFSKKDRAKLKDGFIVNIISLILFVGAWIIFLKLKLGVY